MHRSRALVGVVTVATLLSVASASAQSSATPVVRMGRGPRATGWLIGQGRLFLTNDVGRTWRDATPGFGVSSDMTVAFADERTVWAVAVPDDGPDGQVAVLRSLDAGQTWEERALATGVGDIGTVRIAATSDRHAWVLTRRVTSSNFSDGTLARTVDGGRTWEYLPAPPIADEVLFASTERGWLTGGPSGREVFATGDGGRTWESIASVLGTHIGRADDASIAASLDARGRAILALTCDSRAGAELRLMSAGGELLGPPIELQSETSGSVAAQDADVERPAAGLRTLSALAPRDLSWSGRRVSLGGRVVALQVEAWSEREAWVLTAEGACAAPKRGCTQRTSLLATWDGGRTVVDLTQRLGISGADADASPRDVALSQNKGFDKCTAASVPSLQTWWNESPYRDVNVYIGGVSRGCSQPLLNADWVREVFGQGWRLIPTWVGYQAPCTSCSTCRNRFPLDPVAAEAEGVREADRASDVAAGLGLGPRTVLYFDLEAYDSTNRPCRDASSAFVSGWSRRMRERGHVAGVYGSATNASQDWTASAHRPDAVWIGKWDQRESVWGLTPLSDAEWSNNQRIHQYRGGHDETWGGVTFNIDNDIEDGPVAAPAGVAAPDGSGPEVSIASPREGEQVDGAMVLVTGTASDAGRGESGILWVAVNGTPAEGGRAAGGEVARWSARIVLPDGEQVITVEARDGSEGANLTRATVRVVARGGGPPGTTPPPSPPTGPTTLVGGLTEPRAIAADGASVFWIDSAGRVGRASLDGAAAGVLREGLVAPTALALDAAGVLVADASGISRWPKDATDMTAEGSWGLIVEDSSRVSSLLVVGEVIYWADAGRGEIRRATIRDAQVVTLVGETPEPTSLRFAQGRLWWIEGGGEHGAVRSSSPDGSDLRREAEGANTPALSVAEGQVLWGQTDGDGIEGRLMHLAGEPVGPRTLVDGVRRPAAVLRRGSAVFWAEAVADGVVWAAAADGSAATRLASNLAEPIALEATDTVLLWLERGGAAPESGRIGILPLQNAPR